MSGTGEASVWSDLKSLSMDPVWLRLGHYEATAWGKWRSHVDDPAFFLSSRGAEDPLAELEATLTGLQAPTALGDDHVRCRYPARSLWLQERLPLPDLPAIACPSYRAWLAVMQPAQVVLVFPAAYLNSPSSMFGHTLLRIDPPATAEAATPMLGQAVNFGATIEGNDSGVVYAWRGLMGGYPGQFAVMPYFKKLNEYSRLENRDLWEYTLDLNPVEVQRLAAHLWELQAIRFDYYFFDENCSYRLLELLEIARPEVSLTENFQLTAIPADTVREVLASGMVAGVSYRPSRERELQVRVQELTAKEQVWVQQLAAGDVLPENEAFQRIPPARQALIMDAAYRLLRYRVTRQARDDEVAEHSYRLLRAISQYPPHPVTVESPPAPETGHLSRSLELWAGSREDRAYLESGLRMAYHDLLDPLEGFPLGAQIEIGQLAIRQYESDNWQLQALQLAEIRSLTPRNRLLRPWSWQVSTGWERVNGQGDNGERLVSYLDLGGGVAGSLAGKQSLGFALLTARVEHNRDHLPWLSPALGINAGLLWQGLEGGVLAEVNADYFHHGEVRREVRLTRHWTWGQRSSFRLVAERSFSHLGGAATDIALGWRWYFY